VINTDGINLDRRKYEEKQPMLRNLPGILKATIKVTQYIP